MVDGLVVISKPPDPSVSVVKYSKLLTFFGLGYFTKINPSSAIKFLSSNEA